MFFPGGGGHTPWTGSESEFEVRKGDPNGILFYRIFFGVRSSLLSAAWSVLLFFFSRPEIQRLKHFSAQRYFGTKDLVPFLRYGPSAILEMDAPRFVGPTPESYTNNKSHLIFFKHFLKNRCKNSVHS